MVVSAMSFAQQWTKPVPAFVPMADDGVTDQYLYNVEAGGFFIGANDYMTRASIQWNDGAKVRMTAQYEDDEKTVPLGTWALIDLVAKFDEYRATFVDNWQAIWVDNNNGANWDKWYMKSLGDNKYQITNTEVAGVLSAFNKFKGGEDSRLYMFDESNEELYDAEEKPLFEGVCSTWAFVSVEEFEAIIPKIAAWRSALALEVALNEAAAKYDGIDLTDPKAIYNNTASTDVELDSARTKLIPQAIVNYQKSKASADNPADFTDLVPNNDFENGTDGWSSTTKAQNQGTATNKANPADYPGTTMTGKFWENWNPSNFAGKLYTKLTGLPDGLYKMTIDACGGSDTWVYANADSTRTGGVDSEGNTGLDLGDTAHKFTIYTLVGEDGELELGLCNRTDCCGWVGIDNVTLTYYGAGDDAYKFWYTNVRAQIIDAMNKKVTPETKYDRNQQQAFKDALAKGDAATTKAEIVEAVAGLQAASNAAIASIAAYDALQVELANIQKLLDESEFDAGSMISYFADFFGAETKDDANDAVEALIELGVPERLIPADCPNVVLDECILSKSEVETYTKTITELYKHAVANSLKPGDDCTSMITNANFTSPTGEGWTTVLKPTNWTWTAGLSKFPCAESYHSTFDICQEVEAPNGIYALSLNGFCRLDDGVDATVPAEIYMNNFASPLMNIADGGIAEADAIDGFNAYLSTDSWKGNPLLEGSTVGGSTGIDRTTSEGLYIPDGMIGASVAFAGDRYKATVYGIVEGGKMTIGLRNLTSTHVWALWGNFKLTFAGKDEEAVEAIANSLVAVAQKLLDEQQDNMSAPAIDALSKAKDAVEEAEGDAEAQYDAVIALNAEITAAHANVSAVNAFKVAKAGMDEAGELYAETATEAAKEKYYELADVTYEDYETAEIESYTKQMDDCAAALRIPNPEGASDDNPIDFTQVIVNPSFENAEGNATLNGWTNSGSIDFQTQTNESFEKTGNVYAERWHASGSLDIHQTIANLPAGTYELTVHAYCETEDGVIYANDGETSVTVPAADFTVIVKLEEGEDLTIGAKCNLTGSTWMCIDDFRLQYFGTDSKKEPTAIEATPAIAAVPVAYYTISGARISSLQKGINLVKMSNGIVKKILVK